MTTGSRLASCSEDAPFEVTLVNARHLENLPGVARHRSRRPEGVAGPGTSAAQSLVRPVEMRGQSPSAPASPSRRPSA